VIVVGCGSLVTRVMLTEQDVTTRNEKKGKKETLLTNKHKHDDVDGKNDCEIKQRETA
jgi:hypothetical protein